MWPFKEKKLEDIFFKKISVHGVIFLIKKIDPVSFLDGSKTMIASYDIYKIKTDAKEQDKAMGKIREHYKDVFLSSVIEPKLRRKPEEKDGMLVDYLFTDWDFSHDLYEQIMIHTYGKKKILQNT